MRYSLIQYTIILLENCLRKRKRGSPVVAHANSGFVKESTAIHPVWISLSEALSPPMRDYPLITDSRHIDSLAGINSISFRQPTLPLTLLPTRYASRNTISTHVSGSVHTFTG